MTRDATAKLVAIVESCAGDPAAIAAVRPQGDALALEAAAEIALRWRIEVVRAVMKSPSDDDAVRELYGELCDRYRDDPAGLQALRPIGEEIRRLEAEGKLPSTLVARSERRPRHS